MLPPFGTLSLHCSVDVEIDVKSSEAFHTLPLIYNYKKKEWCAFAHL